MSKTQKIHNPNFKKLKTRHSNKGKCIMKREGVDGYMVMDALNQKNYELCLKCMH
jgi:hypothetical protein